jgi:hypothetical protein
VLLSLVWSTLFSMPKAAGMQLLLRIRNSPDALALRATRGLLTTTRYAEPGVSIEESGDLSNEHIIRGGDVSLMTKG